MDSQQMGGAVSYNSSPGGSRRIIIVVILIILLVASLIFGGWAYSKMQDYKNNSDKKSAAAVSAAERQLTTQLQAQFDQQSKSPYKIFQGSPTYGSITFNYPKTWSAYVDTSDSNEPINGYFYPDTVPGIQSKTAFALRVELVDQDYSQILQNFSSQITQGQVTAQAYVPPKLKNTANITAGTYLSGQINTDDQTQHGYMLIIKVRDKTLQIYTESADFLSDFNNTILASLTFA
ncbi:MAG: hypothetical protein ACREGG_03580, partial [Candidatus Saccharimonadales bacterium]